MLSMTCGCKRLAVVVAGNLADVFGVDVQVSANSIDDDLWAVSWMQTGDQTDQKTWYFVNGMVRGWRELQAIVDDELLKL